MSINGVICMEAAGIGEEMEKGLKSQRVVKIV